MARTPDELRADFQQHYGLNIDGMGSSFTASHAAALASQLPRGSRVRVAANPGERWGEAEYLLASIDYWAQTVAWVSARCPRGFRPRMARTPADDARAERAAASADPDDIAEKLGIPKDRR